MALQARLRLADIEPKLLDIASEHLAIPLKELSLRSRLIEDLRCDSLDFIELLMEIEETFDVTMPDNDPNSVYKSVFTRGSTRLADLAEAIYLQQGTGRPQRRRWSGDIVDPQPGPQVPFAQLDGVWRPDPEMPESLFEPLEVNSGPKQYRRRSDGMRCLVLPSAEVEIGYNGDAARADEQPQHVVGLDSFVIDAEPVSTTAYCRFLNSIATATDDDLAAWFILDPRDDRVIHMPIEKQDLEWRPIAGTEQWPMMLVSWFGANAYSLWANGQDWRNYRDEAEDANASFLPSEAQWEYAARGERSQLYPWGSEPADEKRMNFARSRRAAKYKLQTLPISPVHEQLGMSPFGLHHVAGNVGQWCRDWYDKDFYRKPEANVPNPVNRTPAHARSERGGSWVGPAQLCRSSYRRGRMPSARGRCLGFRCVSSVRDLK